MCGRFALTLPTDAMATLFAAQPANAMPDLPNYNICPTNDVVAVVNADGVRRMESLRWGFIPHWYKAPNDGPLLINARAESIAEKPAFRGAARERRCLIPATGFYEWTKDEAGNRLPWYIHLVGDGPMVFAGVWQDWERDGTRLRACAIVTCEANAAMARLHHRMPVVLAPEHWGKWLGEEGHGAAALMKAAPKDALAFHRVDPKVNSNRAAGPGLIEPLD
jgi:putative SOS response-associated peptidase YedK